MRNQVSKKNKVKFGFLAFVMSLGMALDLILFGCGMILSMATVTVPFAVCASGLFYSLMRLNVLEFSTGTYCERLNRELNAKAERKQTHGRHKHHGVTHRHNPSVQRKQYLAA